MVLCDDVLVVEERFRPLSTGKQVSDKGAVARGFSEAAGSYDGAAQLQRQVGERLLGAFPEGMPRRWLDMGCGTGYFTERLAQRFPDARGVALDLAPGMLQMARGREFHGDFVAGDMECLPLAGAVFDLLFSSLAVQWCNDIAAVLAEAFRVLRPGGTLLLSSLCQGTLEELKLSWREVDDYQHVNRFHRLEDYRQVCEASSLRVLSLDAVPVVVHYPDVRGVMRSLKSIGAHTLSADRRPGLLGRSAWQRLTQAYEERRVVEGLPVTYQVVYAVLGKDRG